MTVEEFQNLKNDFPDRIKGGAIKQDELLKVLNSLYSQLKDDMAALPELSEETQTKFGYLKNSFERSGILMPNQMTAASINDLANKYFDLQEQVRKNQREYTDKETYHR